jgi:acyl-CoA oxidase
MSLPISSSSPASAAAAVPDRSQWRPLGPAPPGQPAPRVTLPVPLGSHAGNTERDIKEARARTAFDPERIEDVLRDGRIDNSTRKALIDTLQKDPLFADFKKKMFHFNREQKMGLSHLACRRLLEIAERDDWDTQQIIEAAVGLDLQVSGKAYMLI